MDSLGLYDIYDYYYVPFWCTTYFKVIIVCMILLMSIGILLVVIKKINAKRQADLWTSWQKTLDLLLVEQTPNKKFYCNVTHIVKEVAVTVLKAPDGITDTELSTFLKNASFPYEINHLAHMITQGHLYKFDPLCRDEIIQKKEVESVREALTVIKNMVNKN